jgi:hypothetical protein
MIINKLLIIFVLIHFLIQANPTAVLNFFIVSQNSKYSLIFKRVNN